MSEKLICQILSEDERGEFQKSCQRHIPGNLQCRGSAIYAIGNAYYINAVSCYAAGWVDSRE